jgi:hypothetical protein
MYDFTTVASAIDILHDCTKTDNLKAYKKCTPWKILSSSKYYTYYGDPKRMIFKFPLNNVKEEW